MSIPCKCILLLLISLLIVSTYCQLIHSFKSVIVSQGYICDESPGTVKAVCTLKNGKSFIVIHKIGSDFFTDILTFSTLAFSSKILPEAIFIMLNIDTFHIPRSPFLGQFSPPPEV